jgi:hypothetical protein
MRKIYIGCLMAISICNGVTAFMIDDNFKKYTSVASSLINFTMLGLFSKYDINALYVDNIGVGLATTSIICTMIGVYGSL